MVMASGSTSSPDPGLPEKEICARRGSQWLSQDDLEAHLAAVIRLENVGVLLGAGGSMGPLGGMTMAGLWEYFEKNFPDSTSWLQEENFIQPGSNINVEELVDALEITRLEWERLDHPLKLKSLKKTRADLQRAVVHAALLHREWWKNPSSVDTSGDALGNHKRLLHKLTTARQPGQPSPWVFTTNYDLAVEWSAETIGLKVTNGFDGLHRRVFSPHNFDLGYRNMLARGEARFGVYSIYVAKLHGSLSWRTDQNGTVEEHSTGFLWPQIDRFLAGDTDDSPNQLVYPSAAKYLQTVGFVLGELFRRFTEFLARPQSCLITNGYSFSDEHLNRILVSALQNPTLQLVVYLPEAVRDGDKLDLSKCTEWVRRVVGLESPQVTIVGGGADAYLNSMVDHLPDPAIYDEQAAQIREMIKQYKLSTRDPS
jgi:hypothetical protein